MTYLSHHVTSRDLGLRSNLTYVTYAIPYVLGMAQSCAKGHPFVTEGALDGGIGAACALKGAVTGKMVPFVPEGHLHVREGVASV